MESVRFLQEWYQSQCDGDWEHQYGITLGTLDNPGWFLDIDLSGTELDGRSTDREIVSRSDIDWLLVWADGKQFHVAAGPLNLVAAFEAFQDFALKTQTAEARPKPS